jgi:hypothetical protein
MKNKSKTLLCDVEKMIDNRKVGVEAAKVGSIEFWQINFDWREIERTIYKNEKEFQRNWGKGDVDKIKTVASISD